MEQWVKDYYQAYQDALARGDSQAIASSCSEDCVLIPPGRAPFKGREAIANFYNRPPSAPIDLDLDRVVIMGDTALVQGMGHWDEDGKRLGIAFADVFRRNGDKWLCIFCTWNSDTGFTL
jgi:ketosteroid isomerase-like protein